MSDGADTKAALRKAAAVIQRLERRVAELEFAANEPIAIIGVGCRLPGNVNDLASLWELLRTGRETVGPFPPGRFDESGGSPLDPSRTGGVQGGSFIQNVEWFDAEFWGIAPREAALMDPQHRLLLECAWESLENARLRASELRGTRVGVYVGAGSNDYGSRATIQTSDPMDVFSAHLGSSFSAGRLSFLLGLQGPAVAVETACSSALVALHLACRALRSGECDLALAGGVQVLLSPDPFLVLSKFGALSPDGRCKSFSAGADGYGRGEGCGVLVLKRLLAAQNAGDRILGVIRGTAVNHDGPRSGLTTPNGAAQCAVFRQALSDARVEAADVDYIEAHAIGTSLGDVIEVEAIAEVYGQRRSAPLRVGSAKGNLGHLEPASGIAAILKVLSAFEHGMLSPSLHAAQLNPHLEWGSLPLRVVRELEPWPRSERPRRAGISAFGLSGTNAHLILEEGPEVPVPAPPSAPRTAELVVLTAKGPDALNAAARQLRRHLIEDTVASLADIAFSSVATRTWMRHRLVLIAPTRAALLGALEAAGRGETPAGSRRGDGGQALMRPAWLFAESEPRALAAGRRLCEEWPVFRKELERVVETFDRLPSPLRVSLPLGSSVPPGPIDQSVVGAAAAFAFQWSLAALWRSFGVEPGFLWGEGLGEITAAAIAGVFSLTDAASLLSAAAQVAAQPSAEGPRPSRASNPGEAPQRTLRQLADSIEYRTPHTRLVTSANGEEVAAPAYWGTRYGGDAHPPTGTASLSSMSAAACLRFGATRSPLDGKGFIVLEALGVGDSPSECLLDALGAWVARGGGVDWAGVFPEGRAIDLPPYPWQRRRHWLDAAKTER